MSLLHIILVLSDIFIYDYRQLGDSPRYINAANEFLSFNLSPSVHCNTAPGYPLFLAFTKVVTHHNKYLIALLQSVLFCFAVYFFLKSIFKSGYISEFVFNVSYFLILTSPEVFQLNGWTLAESLCVSLLLFMCGCLFNGSKKYTVFLFAFSSVMLVLAKFEYIVVLLPVFIFLLWKRNFKAVVLSIAALSVALALNGYKNFNVYGKFNVTSFGSGSVLYGGNNNNGDGSWHIYRVTKNYVPQSQMAELKKISSLPDSCVCVKEDSLFKSLALQSWKYNAGQQVKTIPVKLAKLWLMPASFDFYTGQLEIKKGLQIKYLFSDTIWPWYGKYKHGFYLIIYWLYLACIIAGFILVTWNGFNRYDFLVISLVVTVSFVYGILFYGLGRFHVPAFAFMVVYFAKGIEYISMPKFERHYF